MIFLYIIYVCSNCGDLFISGQTPPALDFTVTELEYYKIYDFQVIVENEVAKVASEWVTHTTSGKLKR